MADPVDRDDKEGARRFALLGASKGGKARAKSLTGEERKAIASAAASSRWAKRPDDGTAQATHAGLIKIGDLEIPCFVLEDGRRVISGRGMTNAIGMKGRGQGMARIAGHKGMIPHLSQQLVLAIENPIPFRAPTGKAIPAGLGYEATVLQEICDAILSADEAGTLKSETDRRYAVFAKILIRAFARVGIVALVDEATGYQYDRARNELQTILSAYIAEELRPWVQMFPHSFFREMYRLHGWQYREGKLQSPRYAGKFINDTIYKNLPAPVLPELQANNPVVGERRLHRHHQFLTDTTGVPHLDKVILTVTTLMQVSESKKEFWNLFNRKFHPNRPVQQELVLESE